MQIGMVGAGKLGLPVALAMEAVGGHSVMVSDVSDLVLQNIKNRTIPYIEVGAQSLLYRSDITIGAVEDIVAHSEVVFCAVQTPHQPEYEGVTRLPDSREEFDYTFLKAAVKSICDEAERQEKGIVLAVISTVLPGTVDRELRPLFNDYVDFVYMPLFIAMGTTIPDFLNPEFVLLGRDSPYAVEVVTEVFSTLHKATVFVTDVRTAELVKVAYNTFIGFKLIFINAMMEICEKTGADVDDLSDALSLATDRIISPKYLRAGLGDSGGCHPRDQIALSALARRIDLSHDIFEDVMMAREMQTEWVADYVAEMALELDLPVVVLGRAYKPNINLEVGSISRLLINILSENDDLEVRSYEPLTDQPFSFGKAVYVVGTPHDVLKGFSYPRGSVVIDPWNFVEESKDYLVLKLGRRK